MVDAAAKFHGSVYVFGWFYHHDDALADIFVIDRHGASYVVQTGMPHGGVSSLGENLGFSIQIARAVETIDETLQLVFVTRNGRWRVVSLPDLCQARMAQAQYPAFERRFMEQVGRIPNARVLDIGGRSRSGLDRSRMFGGASVTVLDILPGENVDVVGDAHAMASILPNESFDALYSVSVFEHLMMPWAVALQMNRVLKPRGIAYIATHQTLGMHDLPWDFWRFSDTAWDAIFNRYTGFEIVDRQLDYAQFVIPFIWSPGKQDAEHSAGYEVSAVLVRKTSEPTVAWDVVAADLTATSYPA